MFKYFIYKFGQFCVTHLNLKLAYRIAMFLSTLQYYFSPRDQRAVKDNLKVILPPGKSDKEISHLSREVFRNFGKYLVDFFRIAKKIDKSYIDRHVKIKDIENLKEALSHNKGGIILTAHVGNWELGAVILSMLGYPIVAVALPHKERPVNDLFNDQRESKGVVVVQIKEAFRKCLAALKENRLIGLLADRDFTMHGEHMDFLGRKKMIPKGAAVFAMKTGAPIIPVFMIREDNDNFVLSFGQPIVAQPKGSEKETLLATMKQYTAVIEQKILEYPTQWLMFRRFWQE